MAAISGRGDLGADGILRPLAEISDVHERSAHTLRASSEGLNWRHLLMLDFHEPAFSAIFPPAKHHQLLYLRRGTVRINGRIAGVRTSTTLYPGQLNLVPADADVAVTTESDYDCLHLYISSEIIADVFEQFCCPDDNHLVPQFAIQDQLLGGLVQACAAQMHAPTERSPAYVEHLSWAIAAQLVQAFSRHTPESRSELKAGLPADKLRTIDDYIRAHLAYDIGVADLAKAAGYSAAHFARIFRKAVGVAPYRYLQERRVEAVRDALHLPSSLADIAAATGFCNQEHMTRVFRELHGITPGRYRRLQVSKGSR